MKARLFIRLVLAFALVGLATSACGMGASPTPKPPTPSPVPATPTPEPEAARPAEGHCGDGVCDGLENAQNCPQDCAATELPSFETPIAPTSSPGRACVRLEWRSSYGPCQADDLYAEMEFTWSLAEDGALIGSGEGTMYAEPVSRCPNTDYGGVRTPEPYPVVVTSTATANGWMVELVATDVSQAYSVSGAVYREECILCWVLPQYKGLGVSGSLSSFSLPRELQAGDTFRFELDYHVPQLSWTNDHVGTGTLEILEVPH